MATTSSEPSNTGATGATGVSNGVFVEGDIISPLYMHPSDNPGTVLVTTSFDGVGYGSWKRGVLRALSAKNKIGFVNGECRKPDPGTSRYRQWERCDNMVTSWILNSLVKEIVDSVEYVSSSFELWKELDDRYDQTNGEKLYQVQRELSELSQGTLDITAYYTKMKKLWEEINSLQTNTKCSCDCTCGAKEHLYKAEQDRKLVQFFMGLNEAYTVVRGNILMMNPLPTLAQTFSLLVQEERQKEIKPSNQSFMDSTSLSASSSTGVKFESAAFSASGSGYKGGNNSKTPKAGYSSGNTGYSFGGGNFITNYSQHIGYSGNRSRTICDYYERPGHTKDKCYKLHGYPQGSQQDTRNNFHTFQDGYHNNNQNYKNNKGKGLMVDVHGPISNMGSASRVEHGNEHNMSLTKEQYGHILNLLQQFQSGSHVEGVNGNNVDHVNGNASLAGPFNEEASGDW